MAQVQTVTGPIEAEELGTTLIHEHLRTPTRRSTSSGRRPAPPRRSLRMRSRPGEDYDDGRARGASAAMELGRQDDRRPTAMFLGRDVDFMRRVAEETGLQVVPCTGHLHLRPSPPVLPQSATPTRSPTFFVADIEQGIQGTDIKAAFIKCAADEPGVNENIEKIHRAAAKASVETGAPIMAHSRPASNTGPRQIEIFLEEGVEPVEDPDRPHAATPTTSTTSRACSRRASGSGWTATASTSSCPTRSARRRRWRCSSAATPIASSSRPTPARPSTGSRPR